MPSHQPSVKRLPWEAIGAIAGVVGVVATVIIALPGFQNHQATPQPSPSNPPYNAGSKTQTAGNASTEPASHLFKDIVLYQHAAADIDGSKPAITPGLSGITGNNDLYHDASPVSSSRLYTPRGLYAYKGNPAKAYGECMAYLADTTHTLDDYSTLDIGRAFCFKTSDDHLVFLQMTALDGSPGNYNSVTFSVRVWDK